MDVHPVKDTEEVGDGEDGSNPTLVGVVAVPGAGLEILGNGSPGSDIARYVEDQKWSPFRGWVPVEGSDAAALPAEWVWATNWVLDGDSADDGWEYAADLTGEYHVGKKMRDTARRRTWQRIQTPIGVLLEPGRQTLLRVAFDAMRQKNVPGGVATEWMRSLYTGSEEMGRELFECLARSAADGVARWEEFASFYATVSQTVARDRDFAKLITSSFPTGLVTAPTHAVLEEAGGDTKLGYQPAKGEAMTPFTYSSFDFAGGPRLPDLLDPAEVDGLALAHSGTKPHVVLAGGGHANIQVLLYLATHVDREAFTCTLVSEATTTFFSAMLPGCVVTAYSPEDIQIDLPSLCARYDFTFKGGSVRSIDHPDQKVTIVTSTGQAQVHFDVLSINIGASARGLDIPGVVQHALPSRPLRSFFRNLRAAEARLDVEFGGGPVADALDRAADLSLSVDSDTPLSPKRATYAAVGRATKRTCRVVVVGGGAAATELAFCLFERLTARYGAVKVTVVASAERLCVSAGGNVASAVEAIMAEKNVEYIQGRACKVEEKCVLLEDGTKLRADVTVWATGPAAHACMKDYGLNLSRRGYMEVNQFLQSTSSSRVFGAGDCVDMEDNEDVPKAGIYAVRMGPVAGRNIAAMLIGDELAAYTPQKGFLSLMAVGDGRAVGLWKGWVFNSRWLWTLKDAIDTNYMKSFPKPEEGTGSTAVQLEQGNEDPSTESEALAAMASHRDLLMRQGVEHRAHIAKLEEENATLRARVAALEEQRDMARASGPFIT